MQRSALTLSIIFVISGCGSFGNDAELDGTYSNCSWMTDVHARYSFTTNGNYSYFYNDKLSGESTYKSGKWELSNGVITFSISKIGRNESDAKDTSNLTEKYAFSNYYDYDCIRIDNGDKFCKSGSCFK